MLDEKKICKKCINHTHWPGIYINQKGLCQFCASTKKIQHNKYNELMEIVNKYQGLAKIRHNALVMFSGGKDSSYLLYLVKEVFKYNPVAYTCINPLFTRTSFNNIEGMTKKLKIKSLKVRINNNVYRRFMSEGIKYLLKNPLLGVNFGCGLCTYFIYANAIHSALIKNIPIVFCGHDINQRHIPTIMQDYELYIARLDILDQIFYDIFGHQYEVTRHIKDSYKTGAKMPIFLGPLSLKEFYNRQKAEEILKMYGLNKDDLLGLKTNCKESAVFRYLGYKYYGCSDHVFVHASVVRNKSYKSFWEPVKNRQEMLNLIKKEKNFYFFCGTNEINTKNKKRLYNTMKIDQKIFKNRIIPTWEGVRAGLKYFKILD